MSEIIICKVSLPSFLFFVNAVDKRCTSPASALPSACSRRVLLVARKEAVPAPPPSKAHVTKQATGTNASQLPHSRTLVHPPSTIAHWRAHGRGLLQLERRPGMDYAPCCLMKCLQGNPLYEQSWAHTSSPLEQSGNNIIGHVLVLLCLCPRMR